MITKDAHFGGGPVHVAMLIEGLAGQGIECQVACGQEGALLPRLRASAGAVWPIAISRSLDPAAVRSAVRSLRYLRRVIRSREIEIVHTHGGVAGLWGRLAARGCPSVRTVHTLHGIHYLHYPQRWRRGLFIRLERSLNRRTDRIICVSAADREAGLRERLFTTRQCVVIPNAPDTSDALRGSAEDIRAELDLPAGVPLVVHVGRLHPQKGQEFLLRAFKRVMAEIPAARLLIIGDGELSAHLTRLAGEEGVAKAVHFLGWRRDVTSILRAATVFALPSLWEGMPLVLLEAMAAGLPVVATSIDGVREVIRDESLGLLVPPADSDALAAAIVNVLRDGKLRDSLGRNARAAIETRYSATAMAERTAQVYAELLARP